MLVKPRNRISVLARFRKAGAHGRTEKARRRLDRMDLQRQVLVR